jgi:predicted nucleic acid-binding protein
MIVVDASVAVKWVVDEPFSEQAAALCYDAIQARERIIAPPHFQSEVVNAIYQRVRATEPTKHLTADEARTAVATFLKWPVELLAPAGLYETALDFARTHRLPSVYDSLYLVLAELLDAAFWTADRKLIAAVGPTSARIHWIGDYPAASR